MMAYLLFTLQTRRSFTDLYATRSIISNHTIFTSSQENGSALNTHAKPISPANVNEQLGQPVTKTPRNDQTAHRRVFFHELALR